MGKDLYLSNTLDFGILEFIQPTHVGTAQLVFEILSSWALAIVFLTIVSKAPVVSAHAKVSGPDEEDG